MDIETILLIHKINRIIISLEGVVFLLAIVGSIYVCLAFQPLVKRKGRVLLTVLSFFPFPPLLGALLAMPIKSLLGVAGADYRSGVIFIGGNLSIISFVLLTCVVWFTRRKRKVKEAK